MVSELRNSGTRPSEFFYPTRPDPTTLHPTRPDSSSPDPTRLLFTRPDPTTPHPARPDSSSPEPTMHSSPDTLDSHGPSFFKLDDPCPGPSFFKLDDPCPGPSYFKLDDPIAPLSPGLSPHCHPASCPIVTRPIALLSPGPDITSPDPNRTDHHPALT